MTFASNRQILESFALYLRSRKASEATQRNYLSDITHFLNWLNSPLIDPYKIAQSITGKTLEKYQAFLVKNGVAPATINRRFSALRQLGHFFISQGWTKSNPVKKVGNITAKKKSDFSQQLMEKFAKALREEKKSPATIRNYLTDVRGYLEWNQKQ